MCGIVAIVGRQDPDWICRMNAAIVHRGPDDDGIFRDVGVSLGMRRLAIIDIDGGHQPMMTPDERFVLVFNGEIFNAADLRSELQEDGAVFLSDHSDTEVLLHAVSRWGSAGLTRLNGMFAFALYDRRERSLFCARDRFGIKPLYYTVSAGRFALASEPKALLQLPFVSRSADLQSLFHYLTLMYVPGQATALEGISRLRPGHWLRFEENAEEPEIGCWWMPSFPSEIKAPRRELGKEIRCAIGRAVDRWSISDVPVGCLLSGGLDSAGTVGMMFERGHRPQTFTVGFKGPDEGDWDELDLARHVAEKWGADHTEIVLDPEMLLDDLIEMIWYLDEPYGGGLPSWAVFKAMAPLAKVAMTGTGGDELFGNYQKFVPLEGRWRSRIGLGRKMVDRARFDERFANTFYYASDGFKRRVLTRAFRECQSTEDMLWSEFQDIEAETLRDRVVGLDLRTQLPEEFLLMTDRFSMAHSIEARTPFLDHELAELVYSIDPSVRLSANSYKPLLREALRGVVPPELLRAPKKGFVIPLTLWLRGRLKPLVQALLAPSRLRSQGLIHTRFWTLVGEPHLRGQADHTTLLWGMVTFQLWWEMIIEGRSREELSEWVRSLG